MDDLSPTADLDTAGHTGTRPGGSVPFWKLEQTNCPSVHFNYSQIKWMSSSLILEPWHQPWAGTRGSWQIENAIMYGAVHWTQTQIPNLINKQRSRRTKGKNCGEVLKSTGQEIPNEGYD